MVATIPAQAFVTIWQGSRDLAEVAERTGYSMRYASQRASRLRRTAAPGLKRFSASAPGAIDIPDPEAARAALFLADAAEADTDRAVVDNDDGADW